MTGMGIEHSAIRWDGCTFRTRLEADADVELLLDGVRFVTAASRADGFFAQAFAFPPNGRRHMQLCLHANGLPLHAPVRVVWGEPGFHPVDGLPPRPRLPDPDAETRIEIAVGVPGDHEDSVIIVPVFNAPAAVARCLTSLRQYTPTGARLLLIDDASTDAGIAPLLAMASTWPNVRVLRNECNLGFTATVNRGLRECGDDADVVLLNADTEVGPGWLAGLRQAAWARPDHATATAVSNNAGAFSVPELERDNPVPQAWSFADASRCLLQQAGHLYPELPTGNGFCMYIRHDARREVGLLDAEAFPRGYGEENDWCQRAAALGWRHVIAGNVFVAHARSQSFGDASRQALGEVGMAVLRQRYPRYEAMVGAQLFSFMRLALDWRVRWLWAEAAPAARPRVLLARAESARDWPGWDTWSWHFDGRLLRLLDHTGSEREAALARDATPLLCRWLQRHAFEAMGGQHARGLAMLGRHLGIPLADGAAQLGWAFRDAR